MHCICIDIFGGNRIVSDVNQSRPRFVFTRRPEEFKNVITHEKFTSLSFNDMLFMQGLLLLALDYLIFRSASGDLALFS